ncbi:something about silencing protein [Anaeramoeba flamelloides]|uniref:Something about silencing protein n=1 Tax=Anaeramoeba flamelloides TaxID=1746091 RepID=A0ABQ8X230_9EUKA|nr:something about silencing protein [Anaeramoeba flamelloides]
MSGKKQNLSFKNSPSSSSEESDSSSYESESVLAIGAQSSSDISSDSSEPINTQIDESDLSYKAVSQIPSYEIDQEAIRKKADKIGGWGYEKQTFYSSQLKEEAHSDDEQDINEMEKEAIKLQKARAGNFKAEDFGEIEKFSQKEDQTKKKNLKLKNRGDRTMLDALNQELNEIDLERIHFEKINKDISGFSNQEKLKYLVSQSPELLSLLMDLQKYSKEIQERLDPKIKSLKKIKNLNNVDSFYQSQKKNPKKKQKKKIKTSKTNVKSKNEKKNKKIQSEKVNKKSKKELKVTANPSSSESKSKSKSKSESKPKIESSSDFNSESESESEEEQFVRFSTSSSKQNNGNIKNKEIEVNPDTNREKRKLNTFNNEDDDDNGMNEENISKRSRKNSYISNQDNDDEANNYYQQIEEQIKLKRKKKKKKKKQKKKQNRRKGKTVSIIPEPDKIVKDGEKRNINYQILKNADLTKRINKKTRNPRIKRKLKYQKAMNKWKTKVGGYKKLKGSYSGESSGIKMNITRSIQFGGSRK